MRLYLALAVLVLAFVAYTDAQEEQTIEQRFAQFNEQMNEMGTRLAEGAKATFEKVRNSEMAVNARTWFSETFDKMKDLVRDKLQ